MESGVIDSKLSCTQQCDGELSTVAQQHSFHCMKPLQSLFSLVTGTHETTGSRIHHSHNALVPQILEQKKDCLQSNFSADLHIHTALHDIQKKKTSAKFTAITSILCDS